MKWHDMTWYEVTWHDMIRHYMTWGDMTWHYVTWHDTTRHDMLWHDTTWHKLHDTTRHDMLWHDMTLHYMTRHDTTWYDTTWHHMAWHDLCDIWYSVYFPYKRKLVHVRFHTCGMWLHIFGSVVPDVSRTVVPWSARDIQPKGKSRSFWNWISRHSDSSKHLELLTNKRALHPRRFEFSTPLWEPSI